MPKKKSGPRKKAGKKGWVFGTKIAFFESRKDEWLAAVKRGKPGDFYSKVTRMYKIKYEDLPYDQDLAEDIDDPEDDSLDYEEDEGLTEEEIKEKQEEFQKLRTVRIVFLSLKDITNTCLDT